MEVVNKHPDLSDDKKAKLIATQFNKEYEPHYACIVSREPFDVCYDA